MVRPFLRTTLFYWSIVALIGPKCKCIGKKTQLPKEKHKGKGKATPHIHEDNKAKELEPTQQAIEEATQPISAHTDKAKQAYKQAEDDGTQSEQGLPNTNKKNSDKSGEGAAAKKPDLKSSNVKETIKECAAYCVLLHGLAEYSTRFQTFISNLEGALKQRGWTNMHFILPTSRESWHTIASLESQAKNVLEEVKRQAGNAPVHLVGYSQGGLVAGELERLYGDQLNIVSSTYICTPFLGVGAMEATQEELNAFLSNTKQSLSELPIDPKDIEKAMKWNSKVLSLISHKILNPFTKGLTAVHPDNKYTKELVEYMRAGSKKVPHFLIGCYAYFNDLFDMDPQAAKILESNYAKLLKKEIAANAKPEDNSMKNDTMVPFDSQLARWGSIDQIDLAGIDNGSEVPGPKGCMNTTQYVFPKTPHAWNLPILHNDLYIEKGYPVLDAPKVASRIADFLSDQMEKGNQPN